MNILMYVLGLGFDVMLSSVIISPLLYWALIRVRKVINKNGYKLKDVAKSLDPKTKMILATASLVFIVLILFPGQFSYRGKLDAVTWILILVPPVTFIHWLYDKTFREAFPKFTRKLISLGLTLYFIGGLVVSYGVFAEAQTIVVNRQEIDIDDATAATLKGKTFVLVSDIHMGPIKNESFLRKSVAELNKVAKSEAKKGNEVYLVIPGDFIASKFEEAPMLYPLADLKGFRSFAALGNHDFDAVEPADNIKLGERFKKILTEEEGLLLGKEVARVLEETGIDVLRNEYVVIDQAGGKRVVISGIDDIWSPTSDNTPALNGLQKDDTVILVAHNPDIVLDLEKDKSQSELVDVILTGHTHGGEIRTPAIPGVDENGIPLFPLPTKLGHHYDEGYFLYEGENGNLPLYITSGLGQSGTKARLFNPPEIVVISFK